MKYFLAFLLSLSFSCPLLAKKFDPPKITAEKAIMLARKHIKTDERLINHQYILTNVNFNSVYNEYEEAHWALRWTYQHKDPIKVKGGWFKVIIYNSLKIGIIFGE